MHRVGRLVRLFAVLQVAVGAACGTCPAVGQPGGGGADAGHDVDIGDDDRDAAAGGDDAAVRPGDPDASVAPAGPMPVMIAADNYARERDALSDDGPFLVYAWATDPAIAHYEEEIRTLEQIDEPDVTEMVMFSSVGSLDNALAGGGADRLRAAGVTMFGFNTEGQMTPANELDSVGDQDGRRNAVARFVASANAEGFAVYWGPIRATADHVSDGAIGAMIDAGLAGIGLQEQRFIENECVRDRAQAVEDTAARYRRIAGDRPFDVQVQVMPSRCLTGDAMAASCGEAGGGRFAHCAAFADAIEPSIDSLAIWASGPQDLGDLVPLIDALRR